MLRWGLATDLRQAPLDTAPFDKLDTGRLPSTSSGQAGQAGHSREARYRQDGEKPEVGVNCWRQGWGSPAADKLLRSI